ncbi:hypothetical protein [uncultured Vibrio sp.]|uniref:hypothetical protein n=1 Tax=uncultured Vibrio sp. TaxID=114054 RepID=UPI0025FF7602|nr:hypothetical protein [uncultured Vibrio sp.]
MLVTTLTFDPEFDLDTACSNLKDENITHIEIIEEKSAKSPTEVTEYKSTIRKVDKNIIACDIMFPDNVCEMALTYMIKFFVSDSKISKAFAPEFL